MCSSDLTGMHVYIYCQCIYVVGMYIYYYASITVLSTVYIKSYLICFSYLFYFIFGCIGSSLLHAGFL